MVKSIRNIFPHGRQTDQGVGDIRIGQATVVVALDGSGDAENIQEGIDLLESTGGVVYIKEGTYQPKATILINNSNTMLIGAGNATIIKPTAALTSKTIDVNAVDECTIQDLQIDNTNTTSATGINIVNADNILITNCIIKNMSNAPAIDVDKTTDSRFIANDFSGSEGLNIATANKCTFIGNLGGTAINISANSDRNIIVGNYLGELIIDGATENQNIIIGNLYESLSDSGTDTQIGHNIDY